MTVSYGKGGQRGRVISGLDFALPPGSLLCVVGQSGCGKTTLIKTLAGTVVPQAGRMLFNGRDLRPSSVRIGLAPQNYALLPWKTVRGNCLFALGGGRRPERAAQSELESLCGRLGILPLLNRYPRELSGGQAQRVSLARALIVRPELLLLDEPFAALDMATGHSARALTLQLWRDSGAVCVLISHSLDDALFLATHVAVMGKGGAFEYFCDNPWQGADAPNDAGYRELLGQLKARLGCAGGGS